MRDEPLISIVLPAFHKFLDLVTAAEHSILYTDKRVELVVVADEPSEERFYHWWINHHSRRYRVRLLVCDDSHPWRPPCLAINAGIRHSRGLFVIIQSPESVAMFPHHNYLFEVLAHQERPFYLTGLLAGAAVADLRDGSSFPRLYANQFRTPIEGYGWILFRRKDALAIGGMDESRTTYGGDDDSLRKRLEAYGCTPICDSNIRIVHLDRETRPPRIEPFSRDAKTVHLKMGTSAFRVASDWCNL